MARVLLDNCVPWRLGQHITGHDVASVAKIGWGDLLDGPLLDAMAGQYDVLITMDRSLPSQQRLDNRPFGVIILRARSNRLAELLPLLPVLAQEIGTLRAGVVRTIG